MASVAAPVITVNGTVIPASRIAAEAQNHPAASGRPGDAWRAAARALAIRQLLLDEALRRGVAAEPEDLGGARRETEEEARIRALLDVALEVTPPSEAEVMAEWQAHPERYRSPDLWDASHILCAAAPSDAKARAAAEDRAGQILARLEREPEAFAVLARSESDCGSREAGGALGQVSTGQMVPEFEAALAAVPEGGLSREPVASRFGFHIIKVHAHAPGQPLPFATVRPVIAEALERAAWARASRDLVAQLVSAARIEGIAMEES